VSRLVLRDVGIDVGRKPLLRDVSFDVPESGLTVVLGASGSGKTTLLKAIAGLHPIKAGTIHVDEKRVDRDPPEVRNIVLLHQEDTLFPHLDVQGNIGFGPRLRGVGKADARARTRELLDLVGLHGFENRRVATLSGGERQRVALARALAVRPRVLLLDEPFSSLDRALRQTLRQELVEILRQALVTAVFVTHDREEALSLGNELVILAEGRIVDQGPPQNVFRRPATTASARVLGRRNLFAFIRSQNHLETGIGALTAPQGSTLESGWLLINEEEVKIVPKADGPARVDRVEFLGSSTTYRIRLREAFLFAELQGPPRFGAGDRVDVDIDAGSLVLYASH
jgi:ABC-type Fe3+/spermidine/putrescine transport system ATPase subunit